jgi:hypothetical protein
MSKVGENTRRYVGEFGGHAAREQTEREEKTFADLYRALNPPTHTIVALMIAFARSEHMREPPRCRHDQNESRPAADALRSLDQSPPSFGGARRAASSVKLFAFFG